MIRPKTSALAGTYLLACLALGGASAAGLIANALLQLTGLAIILYVLWRRPLSTVDRSGRGLVLIVSGFVVLNLVSLIPLPPGLWADLPGREPVARGYDIMAMPQPWLPLSLARDRTIGGLLSLLPPAAMYLLAVRLDTRGRRLLAWLTLGFAAFSIILSAFQLFGGAGSPLRFYVVTNPNRAVGFFASANHLPTLILCALPVAGMLAASAVASANSQTRSGGLTVAIASALFLVAGIGVSQSAAGFVLLIPSALATFLIYRRAVVGKLSRTWAFGVAALFVGFAVLASFGPTGQHALSDKFSEHPTSRKTIWTNSVEAARDFLPLGSGLGTFPSVYRTYDDPDRPGNQFVNHVHNDYLELGLELGVPGLLVALLFIGWYVQRTARTWSSDYKGAALGRLGSVIIAIVLIHSFTDYPLRTAAIQALFAMACAFLVPPPTRQTGGEPDTDKLRHLEAD